MRRRITAVRRGGIGIDFGPAAGAGAGARDEERGTAVTNKAGRGGDVKIEPSLGAERIRTSGGSGAIRFDAFSFREQKRNNSLTMPSSLIPHSSFSTPCRCGDAAMQVNEWSVMTCCSCAQQQSLARAEAPPYSIYEMSRVGRD